MRGLAWLLERRLHKRRLNFGVRTSGSHHWRLFWKSTFKLPLHISFSSITGICAGNLGKFLLSFAVFLPECLVGKSAWENSSLWFCPCPCPVFCPLFLPCYFCPCPVFCPLSWVHINSQRLQHWHVWKAVPSVEQLPGKHQKGVGSFREDNDFADMTLACEDGQQVEAHKVILAASSLFSRSCLEGTSTLTH